jgi:endonuclease YncB( thermonuclease family)
VADGDTITVLDANRQQNKVRLIGIDAPEKFQPFGNRSRQHLDVLVHGRDVVVEWNKRDRYGRILGKVLVGSVDANLEQIRAGLAWHYKQYEREQSRENRETYASAELHARTAKRGLWIDPAPIPPWEFRRAHH